MISQSTATLVFMSILSGCAPIPHYEVVSSAVMGKVHRNGEPEKNALVYIEHPLGESCSGRIEVDTRTDGEGHFQFKLRKEFRLFIAMDPAVHWQVCIVDGNKHFQGWYQSGIGGPPPTIRLDCDLESDSLVIETDYPVTIKGICESDFEI